MSYKLYTDKKEVFECKLHLEGASLNESTARILVETDDISFLFNGKIDKKGNCRVPIKRFKGLLDENTKGNIKLEVIAEGTHIEPWSDDFIVDTSKKVRVENIQSHSNEVITKKPIVTVSQVKNHFNPVEDMVTVLKENGITLKTVVKDKQKIAPILGSYSKNVGYVGGIKKFISEVIKKLSKV